ncbi:hypothetical protein NXW96_22175 [Bacteroides fragilis]|nr:hypothetical protein [Bacteroides fragilis]
MNDFLFSQVDFYKIAAESSYFPEKDVIFTNERGNYLTTSQRKTLKFANIKIHPNLRQITAQKISQDMETLSHKLEDMEKNIC